MEFLEKNNIKIRDITLIRTKALCYYHLKDYKTSLDFYEKFLNENKRIPSIWKEISQLLFKLDRKDLSSLCSIKYKSMTNIKFNKNKSDNISIDFKNIKNNEDLEFIKNHFNFIENDSIDEKYNVKLL
jgi:tetratricopeptide (TPR) repeat protein